MSIEPALAYRWLSGIAAVVILAAPWPANAATAPQPVGEPLDAGIVSMYVPPTRSAEPYAATAQKVYAYDEKESRWTAIYNAPAGSGRILSVAGYAKSSQALYVALDTGVAVTRDAGKSWTFTPIEGLSSCAHEEVSLSVNPINRKEAVAACAQEMWITRDYGSAWTQLALPTPGDTQIRAAYTGGERPWLAVAASSGIYGTATPGQGWQGVAWKGQGQNVLATSPSIPAAMVVGAEGTMRVVDFARPGYCLDLKIAELSDIRTLSLNASGHGALWAASPDKLFLAGVRKSDPQVTTILPSSQPIRNVQAHPRSPNTVYYTVGNQVWQIAAPDTAAKTLAQAFPMEAFEKEELIAASALDSQSAGNPAAGEALRQVLASMPPLSSIVEAALDYADYDDDEVRQWRRNARRRNLLPQVTLHARDRDYPIREYGLIQNVDRYGVGTLGDIHHTDSLAELNETGIELRWELRELLFDPEQMEISKEARQRAQQRNELVTQITRLYYERAELLLEKQSAASKTAKDVLNLELKLRESTDLLNQLCGGELFDQDAPIAVPVKSPDDPEK